MKRNKQENLGTTGKVDGDVACEKQRENYWMTWLHGITETNVGLIRVTRRCVWWRTEAIYVYWYNTCCGDHHHHHFRVWTDLDHKQPWRTILLIAALLKLLYRLVPIFLFNSYTDWCPSLTPLLIGAPI